MQNLLKSALLEKTSSKRGPLFERASPGEGHFLLLTIQTIFERKNMQTEKFKSVSLHSTIESVINHNSGRWFRFIVGILKNESDAEDVLQEAIRRVLTRNRSFPSEEQVRMYLGRAIGNTAFEMYNNRKRDQKRNTHIQESIPLPSGADSADVRMEEKENVGLRDRMIDLLEDGLKQLPSKQEEALRMTILESNGRSMRDIGVTYNIPYSTLRHRNKKGLQRMRSFLKQSLGENGLKV